MSKSRGILKQGQSLDFIHFRIAQLVKFTNQDCYNFLTQEGVHLPGFALLSNEIAVGLLHQCLNVNLCKTPAEKINFRYRLTIGFDEIEKISQTIPQSTLARNAARFLKAILSYLKFLKKSLPNYLSEIAFLLRNYCGSFKSLIESNKRYVNEGFKEIYRYDELASYNNQKLTELMTEFTSIIDNAFSGIKLWKKDVIDSGADKDLIGVLELLYNECFEVVNKILALTNDTLNIFIKEWITGKIRN